MTAELTTRSLPVPLVAAIVAAAAIAVFVLYRREARLLPRGVRTAIVGLRLAFVWAAAILLADPALVEREAATVPGLVAVALDRSRSFSRSDPAARAALSSGPLRGVLARHRVALFAFDADVRPLATLPPGADIARALETLAAPAGTETRLDLAILGDYLPEGEPLAGLLVVTDGNHRGRGDPREAARSWAMRGAPLVLIGAGPLEPPADLRIEAVEASGAVFAGDEISAEATVSWSALSAAETAVAVEESGRRLAEAAVELPGRRGRTRIPLRFAVREPGRRRFVVSAPVLEGESNAANNRRELWLDVREGPIRVLYVDGAPRWEAIYLRSVWSRDERVDLRAFVATPPPLRRLPPDAPRGRDEIFAFDVVVLGDVEPSLFSEGEVRDLADFVKARGGSLVAIAGERAMPHAWARTPLEDVLPVYPLEPAPPRGASAAAAREGLPLVLAPAGERSEIVRLVPGREENLELWELLPPLHWVAPIAGSKPGAQALVRVRADRAHRLPGIGLPRPPGDAPSESGARRLVEERSAVVVAGVSGAGRVLYVGTDSTWRWRRHFGEELFGRFWGRVLRWAAASRLEARDAFVRLGTDAPVYPQRATVRIEAVVESAPGTPLEGGRVEAAVTRLSDGRSGRVPLEPVPASGGRYRAEVALAALGLEDGSDSAPGGDLVEHAVALEIPDLVGYSSLAGRAEVRFAVERPRDEEGNDLAQDEALLRELAELAGGRYLPLSEAGEAGGALREASAVRERLSERRLWDRPWPLAAILLGPPILEWILRKRRDLV